MATGFHQLGVPMDSHTKPEIDGQPGSAVGVIAINGVLKCSIFQKHSIAIRRRRRPAKELLQKHQKAKDSN